jgi:thiosulfate/3-mercaptopyruvate sulfurtransferase
MAAPLDSSSRFQSYANPGRLVSTGWLADHLDHPDLVVVESDEDVLLYETGHIPGAVKVDWHMDLNDPVTRDYISGEAFARLMDSRGITRDTTVVIYGDNFNWWAAYALWVFSLFGHPDVRLLDGGRKKWVDEGRPMTTEAPVPRPSPEAGAPSEAGAPRETGAPGEAGAPVYPVVEREDAPIRAYRDDVLRHLEAGGRLVDVRSPEEYRGEKLHMPDYPQEGAMRGGHIPGARNVPWKRAANDDGTFRPLDELRAIYLEEVGLAAGEPVVAYCRIGERSSHTWFVLTHLLGLDNVRNYDGSWTEWGNMVRAPIER